MKRTILHGLGVMCLIFLLYLSSVLAAAIYSDTVLLNTYREARAVIVTGDRGNGGDQHYQYRVGDRLCHVTAPMDYDLGAVHYDPSAVCTSVSYDPGSARANELIMLALILLSLVQLARGVVNSFRRGTAPSGSVPSSVVSGVIRSSNQEVEL